MTLLTSNKSSAAALFAMSKYSASSRSSGKSRAIRLVHRNYIISHHLKLQQQKKNI